ncbi:MAG: alpha/beta hydrolase, partial [Planctomycetia bacterium]|nr:alpha/beta hydrolase [Planctomycetia bacterium]
MSTLRPLHALTLASIALTTPTRGADEPAPKVTVGNDVVYTKAGGADLKLDLARPTEGDGPFPVVFVIHGGAWRGGNKESNRPALTEFARRGYVAVSPQYRFCPKETFPAQVHDVKAAVRWVKAHAREYKADPGHVGAVGFSAGGHLSMMLGVTGPSDGLEGETAGDGPDSSV